MQRFSIPLTFCLKNDMNGRIIMKTQKPDMHDPVIYYFYRDQFEHSAIGRLTHRQRLLLHPLLLAIIKFRNRLAGFQINLLYDHRTKTDRPVIYAITHICKYDIEIASEIVHSHYYLLSGDYENMKGTTEEKFLGLNGVVYIREDDRKDRALSKEKMISVLKEGGNIMYFPEGTWNLSPNLPVLQCAYGIIDVAMRSGALIVPIGMEQYGNAFHVAVGSYFDVSRYGSDEKTEAIQDLRSAMAALKMDVWASAPQESSSPSRENFDALIQDRVSKWPGQPLEGFQNAIFKPKHICTEKDAFAFLKHLTLNSSNCFLSKAKADYFTEYLNSSHM